ncbi:malate dehydrogenase (quinone) [Micromonospora globispora]|uniref:Probable malate:quinone oxidoreductase n=1 Tax=Micromonospora globispora TaxID=1450148 RepID=A0A317K7U1_9ACTN|nr:malate dehydrogenase (quinone) [Micromonospora globispora]PWU59874.1 malate dehydrogenase (quinone) [Micromonospora globispora]RQW97760.1 malate dehydrogenase (quinone) [Micromonospora globispora]
MARSGPSEDWDVVLIGGGIMSATLGVLLSEVQPDWRIAVVERLDEAGLESSHAWNNAGTGHAGLCEFNYTPRRPDGTVDVSSAVRIGEQFVASLLFWARLVERGALGLPEAFIRSIPHLGLGRGTDGVAYLRARWEALRDHPLFSDQEFSADPDVLAGWLPLMFHGRAGNEPVAVTRSAQGTDVDFGVLTRQLLSALDRRGGVVHTRQEVTSLRRDGESWVVRVRDRRTGSRRRLRTPYVFVGAGGGTLPLLQSARVPEIRRYSAFPISGQFLRTDRPELVAAHRGKVYGHAAPGTPPISVPHLDLRVVDGREALLFGPFAAFSPRFLTRGRLTDLLRSVRPSNLPVLLAAARDNRSLVAYLLRQVTQSPAARMAALRRFVPSARADGWTLMTAGQRVQVLKKTGGRGTLVGFGTEIVTSAGGSLAALLGASPGASTAVSTMLDVLAASFPERMPEWTERLDRLAPSTQAMRQFDPDRLRDAVTQARRVLGLVPVQTTVHQKGAAAS